MNSVATDYLDDGYGVHTMGNKIKKKVDDRPALSQDLNNGFLECRLCNQKKKWKGGVFNRHLQIFHNLAISAYYLQIHGNIWKNCLCGCGKETAWEPRQGYYKGYVSGHNYRGKTKENDSTVAMRTAKMIKSEKWLNSTFKKGQIPWNFGETKETNKILEHISKCLKEHGWSKGKTKQTDEKLRIIGQKVSDRNKELYRLGLKVSYFSIRTEEQIKKDKEKAQISHIKNGNHKTNRFLNGKFTSTKTGKITNFQSGWELERMKQYDEDKSIISWSRCTDLITYSSKDQKIKLYNPDFELVFANDLIIIEEIKGYTDPDIFEKVLAAKQYFDKISKIYRLVTKIKNVFTIVQVENIEQYCYSIGINKRGKI